MSPLLNFSSDRALLSQGDRLFWVISLISWLLKGVTLCHTTGQRKLGEQLLNPLRKRFELLWIAHV